MFPATSFFPDIRNITKFIVWALAIALVIGVIYIGYISVDSFRYRPESIVKRFISLIENPTQEVTENEKKELQEITQSNFLSSWGNENNIKTLRRVSQGNPITSSKVEFSGQSQRIATAKLQFQNDLQNENSKEATLYMERYGNWYTGIKWQIFKIDMPREDNPLDGAKDAADQLQEDLNQGTQDIFDRVKGWFGN